MNLMKFSIPLTLYRLEPRLVVTGDAIAVRLPVHRQYP